MKERLLKFLSRICIFSGTACIITSLVCYIALYAEEFNLYQQYSELFPTSQNIIPYVLEEEAEENVVATRYAPTLLYINDKEEEEEPVLEPKTILIDGQYYIGMIEIPTINLALPIHENWTDAKLDTAPCVYQGSLYSNDLIVGGHNTRAHFSQLHTLDIGTEATITDADATVHTFILKEKTVISEMEVEFLRNIEDYELTLFTCDADSRKRVVLRFHLKS